MYLIITHSSGNGNQEFASPNLDTAKIEEAQRLLVNAFSDDGIAHLPWGSFRAANILNYRLADTLPDGSIGSI